jgi:integrase
MPPTGKDLINYLIRIFKLAIRRKYYHGENPADWDVLCDAGLPDLADVYRRKPRSAGSYQDAPLLLAAVRGHKDRSARQTGRLPISYATEMILLTIVRVSEVLEARWGEFDRVRRIWNVPLEHRKFGKKKNYVRPVPITTSMDSILDDMEKLNPNHAPTDLVFPGPRSGDIIKTSAPANFIAKTLGLKGITPHGIRNSMRDWMRNHFNDSSKEVLWKAQADHKLGENPTDSIYGRDLLLEKRRPMMQMWDDYCSKPRPEAQPGNVVKLQRKNA